MSGAAQFYTATILVYAFVYIIAVTGLNLQFGVSGIFNFAFIVFQAAGAYTTAVLTLGSPAASGNFQHYIVGLSLPFPVPLLISAVVSGVLGLLVGLLTLRRLRSDYLAIVMLVVSLIATEIVTNQVGLFNGAQGLALIPQPLASVTSSPTAYDWLYVALAGVIALIVWFGVRAVIESPLGRTLRAVRENEPAAASLGKNVVQLRLFVFAVGGAIGGISGSVLVGFLKVWSPAAWFYPETFVLFTAIVVGGMGSNWGPVVGALLVPVGLGEGSRYLPQIGSATLMPSLQWIAIGIVLLGFLWFWPRGVIPERRRLFAVGSGETGVAALTHSALHNTIRLMDRVPALRPETRSDPPALEVRQLSRSFGGLQAVADVSFSAVSGSITGLIGPNGAGKSTTLAIVAGSLSPTAGSVLFRGRDVTGMPSYRLARLGVGRTFQMVGDFDRLTVLENLLVAAPHQIGERVHQIYSPLRSWRRQEYELVDRARLLLARFELSGHENAYAGELSGGQRRLMELARALMASPTLLLLDEPMAGVNPRLMRHLGDHLLDLARSGLAIVLVEHELRLIEQVCEHVVVLAQGRVIGSGSMAEVRQMDEVVEAYIAG